MSTENQTTQVTIRGGSWHNNSFYMRPSYRYSIWSDKSSPIMGLHIKLRSTK